MQFCIWTSSTAETFQCFILCVVRRLKNSFVYSKRIFFQLCDQHNVLLGGVVLWLRRGTYYWRSQVLKTPYNCAVCLTGVAVNQSLQHCSVGCIGTEGSRRRPEQSDCASADAGTGASTPRTRTAEQRIRARWARASAADYYAAGGTLQASVAQTYWTGPPQTARKVPQWPAIHQQSVRYVPDFILCGLYLMFSRMGRRLYQGCTVLQTVCRR